MNNSPMRNTKRAGKTNYNVLVEHVFMRVRAGHTATQILRSGILRKRKNVTGGVASLPSAVFSAPIAENAKLCYPINYDFSEMKKSALTTAQFKLLENPIDLSGISTTLYVKGTMSYPLVFVPGIHKIKYNVKISDVFVEGVFYVSVGESFIGKAPEASQHSTEKIPELTFPSNIELTEKSLSGMELVLRKLSRDGYIAWEEDLQGLTRRFLSKEFAALRRSERPDFSAEDIMQEARHQIVKGALAYLGKSRPETSWGNYLIWNVKRYVLRRSDATTHETHDVNRLRRFAAHYQTITTGEELRERWVCNVAIHEMRKKNRRLTQEEALMNIDIKAATEKCSLPLAVFKAAMTPTAKVISLDSTSYKDDGESVGTLAEIIGYNDPDMETVGTSTAEEVLKTAFGGSGLSLKEIMPIIKSIASAENDTFSKKEVGTLAFENSIKRILSICIGRRVVSSDDRKLAMGILREGLLTEDGLLREAEEIKLFWESLEENYHKVTPAKKKISLSELKMTQKPKSPKATKATRKKRTVRGRKPLGQKRHQKNLDAPQQLCFHLPGFAEK